MIWIVGGGVIRPIHETHPFGAGLGPFKRGYGWLSGRLIFCIVFDASLRFTPSGPACGRSNRFLTHLLNRGVLIKSSELAIKKPNHKDGVNYLGGIIRPIPGTHPCGAACGCSNTFLTHLSNRGVLIKASSQPLKSPTTKTVRLFNGAPGGIRTPDHLVRSQVLYPAELRARNSVLIV